MLLNFKVKNYLSFKDEAWFSLEANKKIRTLPQNKNIIKLKNWENIWLNKSAIFYGANASWKTNILKWLDFVKYITLNSSKFKSKWGIKKELNPNISFDSFLLDDNERINSSDFELEFLIDKVKYKYILKLNKDEIIKEKLNIFEKKKEKTILNRQITKWEIEEEYFWFKKDDFNKLNLFPRTNQTFLSIFADRETWEYKFTSDNKIVKAKKYIWLSTKINSFFTKMNFINSKSDFTWMTLSMLKDENVKKTILSFMNNADINIKDIKQKEEEVTVSNENPWFFEINWQRVKAEKIVEVKTDFIHPVYKEWKKVWDIPFDFIKQESQWTQKLLSFLWPIIKTIKSNWVLLIDEIDTHMHFLLIENLIKFIHWINQEDKNNIWNAQFVFNTHNLDLMDLDLFRKDQIFFTSKNNYWCTEIYSLDDFKDIQIRNNSDIKKAYKFWIFGAVPFLSDFYL